VGAVKALGMALVELEPPARFYAAIEAPNKRGKVEVHMLEPVVVAELSVEGSELADMGLEEAVHKPRSLEAGDTHSLEPVLLHSNMQLGKEVVAVSAQEGEVEGARVENMDHRAEVQ
jgi:hypothetical protein